LEKTSLAFNVHLIQNKFMSAAPMNNFVVRSLHTSKKASNVFSFHFEPSS